MSRTKTLLIATVVAGLACMMAPPSASAEPSGTVLCTDTDGAHPVCKTGNGWLVAEAWASPVIENNYVLIKVYSYNGCQMRCNASVDWGSDGETYHDLPAGRYDHDVPEPATSLGLFCYCQ